jgi:hypothetical protein
METSIGCHLVFVCLIDQESWSVMKYSMCCIIREYIKYLSEISENDLNCIWIMLLLQLVILDLFLDLIIYKLINIIYWARY